MDQKVSMWIEQRAPVMVHAVKDDPEIVASLKLYTRLVARSMEVPREERQQALRRPEPFAHSKLVNLCKAAAFDEHALFKMDLHTDEELLERIREDIGTEIDLVMDHARRSGSNRTH